MYIECCVNECMYRYVRECGGSECMYIDMHMSVGVSACIDMYVSVGVSACIQTCT